MKKLFLFVVLSFILGSCLLTSPLQYTSLQGKYQDSTFSVTTNKTKDEIWNNIVDVFANKGIPISIIDKSSGLIVSNKLVFTSTYELLNGLPKDTEASIIYSNVYDNRFPSDAIMPLGGTFADFNVRVKEVNGKTQINVNIQNISYNKSLTRHAGLIDIIYDVKSTGKFEKIFIDEVLK